MAIWPVTVPNPEMYNHREAAMLALPEEDFLNPGKKAHSVDEAVEGKSASAPSMCYLMRMGMSMPWMMQANCTSRWSLDRLLLRRPRRKI